MEMIELVERLRARIGAWRAAGARVAFVPTMGNLHDGHLALVEAARAQAERVVVSVFVNPLQFGPKEDLAAYPRTLERDCERLAEGGCDLVFVPAVASVYPRGSAAQTIVEVPGLSDVLCGASRPGHFRGVATVVCKLFNMVQPDLACFGEKDFQQLLVIRRMVEDLAMPVQILAVPTVREADGLAMSSRNGYLTASERALAPTLYRVLCAARDALQTGLPVARVEQQACADLRAAGLLPDYVAVRAAADLRTVTATDAELVILAAARLGHARLIDNLRLRRDPPGGAA
ncbi:pantoate--beta-alanine ligase [Thiocapsa imhoffii]|uniref:Pantothenate synthetase n=1 Tax=Thiocapsa imhoffii TaxID=382777 RepID=A0A9X0WGZ1_9GAMM|nr:pantoate--beta-alanine ligase [Thiocapsa imhoffii]MBK1644351.1 pantoate--beta-alanine ligase [Thiocapsa imhoffii]